MLRVYSKTYIQTTLRVAFYSGPQARLAAPFSGPFIPQTKWRSIVSVVAHHRSSRESNYSERALPTSYCLIARPVSVPSYRAYQLGKRYLETSTALPSRGSWPATLNSQSQTDRGSEHLETGHSILLTTLHSTYSLSPLSCYFSINLYHDSPSRSHDGLASIDPSTLIPCTTAVVASRLLSSPRPGLAGLSGLDDSP